MGDTSILRRLRAQLSVLRGIDPDITVLQAQFFVELALLEQAGADTRTSVLAERLTIHQSTATRCTDLLGSHGRGGRRGAKLVRRDADPHDRRMKRLTLTSKGTRLIAELGGGGMAAAAT